MHLKGSKLALDFFFFFNLFMLFNLYGRICKNIQAKNHVKTIGKKKLTSLLSFLSAEHMNWYRVLSL